VGATVWGATARSGPYLRRGAILLGLATGTVCYAILRPISFRLVSNAPLLVTPQWFPFGFSVRPELVVVFLLVLIPAGMGSMAMYEMVGHWGNEKLTAERMSQGIFAVAIGFTLAGAHELVALARASGLRVPRLPAELAAGLIGGAIVGGALAGPGYYGYGPGYYGPGYGYYGGPAYVADDYCVWQRQRFWDGFGWRVRNVRVCG